MKKKEKNLFNTIRQGTEKEAREAFSKFSRGVVQTASAGYYG